MSCPGGAGPNRLTTGKAEQEDRDDERLEVLARPFAFQEDERIVGDLHSRQGGDALDLGDRKGMRTWRPLS